MSLGLQVALRATYMEISAVTSSPPTAAAATGLSSLRLESSHCWNQRYVP